MKNLLFALLSCIAFYQAGAQSTDSSAGFTLLIGTYTNTGSRGIYVYRINRESARPTFISVTQSSNPSFVTVGKNRNVYAVNEDKAGMVSAFNFLNGKLMPVNEVASGGADPCYVTQDKTGKWVVAGNYTGGNFSVFPLLENGALGAALTTIAHAGNSVNKERQEKAHVHCTMFSPDNKYLLVADLGTDEIVRYKFNDKTGAIGKEIHIKVQAGAGPRHLAFHPGGKYVYLTEELFGNVAVYRYKKGKLKLQQTISMVPPKFIGTIGAADLHLSADGRFLYSSNRGTSDKITIFSVNSNGTLKVTGYQSVLGFNPRNFTIDPSGNFLLVANQGSDEVVIFKRDKYTGLLTDTGQRIKLPKPVCLTWAQ